LINERERLVTVTSLNLGLFTEMLLLLLLLEFESLSENAVVVVGSVLECLIAVGWLGLVGMTLRSSPNMLPSMLGLKYCRFTR
jgi:hypothetical protein